MAVGNAAVLGALLRQLGDSQWLTREEIEAMQRRQLARLAAHCAKYSRHFRRTLREAGLKPAALVEPGALQKLPILTRREVQAGAELFCSMAPNSHMPVIESATTGSTGTPVTVRRTSITGMVQCGLVLRGYAWHGRHYPDRVCTIRVTAGGIERRGDWGPPANLLFATGPALNIPVEADIDAQIDLIRDFEPTVLSVSPTNLIAIGRRCVERGVELPSVEMFYTIGETVAEDTRAEVRETLGQGIVDTYSSMELGCIAIQCPASELYHIMSEAMVVEVIDENGHACAEGQPGRVVITDLLNFATPLVRYAIGDWAEPGPPCPCGRGLPTLRRIFGRERNLVRLPDGTRHWPRLGNAHYRRIAPVIQLQVVQESLEDVELRLVVARPLTEAEEAALAAHLQAMLAWPFRIRITYYETEIPAGPGGKYEDFVSRVA